MFADLVLIGENLEGVNKRLDEWRLALEGKGLRINRNKIEYIEYDFGRRHQEVEAMRSMTISSDINGEVKNLKYLGSLVQKDERGT
jgi:hypothetical protein